MENSPSRFKRWFELILTMLDGEPHTSADLAAVLNSTRRNLYYVFREFEKLGFIVLHEGRNYSIDPCSPFLRRIASNVQLSPIEASYLCDLLSEPAAQSAFAGILSRKITRFYRLDPMDIVRPEDEICANICAIEQAIADKQVVILHDYTSGHSRSVSDRVVEPFVLHTDKEDIRAYEIKSKTNKTFKISRIGWVENMDVPWFNEDQHKEVFTDMFMFSGDERHRIKLRLSVLAHRLMLEEYPHSASFMKKDGENHWILDTEVVNYVGISRFILGLFDDVEVIEDEGLKDFLQDRIRQMSARITNT